MKERTKEEIYKDIEEDLPDIPGEPFLTPAAVHKAFEYRWRSSSGVFIHDTLPEMYDMWKSCTFNEYVKMWEEQLLKGIEEKQRNGEELTPEEEEAMKKAIAGTTPGTVYNAFQIT